MKDNFGPWRVLSVDDDARMRQTLVRYLQEEGFLVDEAASAQAMRQALAANKTDVVLLDVILGRDNGLDLAREIREKWPDIGVIMMTARSDAVDRVIGLEFGADDYITKPFNLREVVARIRSLTRRLGRGGGASTGRKGLLRFQGWQLDLTRRRLTAPDGNEIPLTSGEFNLLTAFATHPGHILDRDYLISATNGQNWHAFDRTIDARVSRLRKKIDPDTRNPQLIKSVRGIGYVFTARVE